MNLNDLITVSKILCNVDISRAAAKNRKAFIIGYTHIKSFIDCNYGYLAVNNIDLAMADNKTSKVPQSLLKGRLNINEFEDGEIIHKAISVVFQGKNRRGYSKDHSMVYRDKERVATCYEDTDLNFQPL